MTENFNWRAQPFERGSTEFEQGTYMTQNSYLGHHVQTSAQRCRLILFCVAFALAPACVTANPPAPPARIDLSHWKLTLPVDDSGNRQGHAAEVLPDRLADGGNHPEFFQVAADGALVFWCPVDGATTEGTEYPRTELRELLDPESPQVNWPAAGLHVLRARCQVREVPSSQKVIIGQIHSYTGKARPLVKLQFYKGRIEGLVKISPDKGQDRKLVWEEIPLNAEVDYEIRLEDGRLDVTVNGRTQSENVVANDPAWGKQTFYFKAGAYVQDNMGPSTEGARVVFSHLQMTHDVVEN